MPINATKNQKTSGGFSEFYTNDWKKWGIGINILHSISYDLQRLNQGPARLKK